jgi:hypothetical protein
MGRVSQDTTSRTLVAAYDAIVTMGAGTLAEEARRMRDEFQRRTGAFLPEDAWFEPRSRAFWDDALTTQGFAALAKDELDEDARALVPRFARAHRGLFQVTDVDDAGARLVDVWSGAELLVRHLDEAQAVTLEHAEGLMDARVVAASVDALYVLPGAFHHAADASESALRVVDAARARDLDTGRLLDALMRMELVFRSSSRVKAAFAYRVDSLPRSA